MKRDVTVTIKDAIWMQARNKLQQLFQKKLKETEILEVTILLTMFLLEKDAKKHKEQAGGATEKIVNKAEDVRNSLLNPSDVSEDALPFTIAVYSELLESLVENWKKQISSKKLKNSIRRNDIIEYALAIVATTDTIEYLVPLQALYTFTGYKNPEMQAATASAVSAMNLPTQDLTLVEVCCGSAALTLGLEHSEWKQIVLNDLDPLKTNFINVLIHEPIKLVDTILGIGITYKSKYTQDKTKIESFVKEIDAFAKRRKKYHQVACDIEIAAKFFLCACTKNNFRNRYLAKETILKRLLCFLPAAFKLWESNTVVTQEDAMIFLENNCTINIPRGDALHLNTQRFIISDTPYPCSEEYSGLEGYNYEKFHGKVANRLIHAEYPFLYFCRSTATKSDSRPIDIKNHAMKLFLARLFFDKGLLYDKVRLSWGCKQKEDGSTTESAPELIISNRHYSDNQFIWNSDSQDLT